MGMQDRDYYREWWAEKEGYKKPSKLQKVVVKLKPNKAKIHPLLTCLFTAVLCFGVFVLVDLIARYGRYFTLLK